jgi:hypothetical protein
VDIVAWDESLKFVRQISADPRLQVGVIPWTPEFHGHSDTYVDKTRLIQGMPSDDTVLFLDSDTLVYGPVDYMFDLAEIYTFAGTQFNDWVTTGSIISGRLRSLLDFPEIDQSLIHQVLVEPWPSVNTGIFAALPNSPVLSLWNQWTKAASKTFIPDEKVMHVLYPKFTPADKIAIVRGGAFNCSPRFQPADLPDDRVIIRHFHGHSNVRPSKSNRGWCLWQPVFEHCRQLNFGGIATWYADVGNKWIKQLLENKLIEV